MAALQIRTIGDLQQFMGCDNAHWKTRRQEEFMWGGTTSVKSDDGKELWKGNAAITRDGDNYRLRVEKGVPLPGFIAQGRPQPGSASAHIQVNQFIWWSSSMFAYFGKVTDTQWVEVLRKIGWNKAVVLTQDEAKQVPSTEWHDAKHAVASSGNGTMNNQVTVAAQAQHLQQQPIKATAQAGAYQVKMQQQPDGGFTMTLPPLPDGYKYNDGGKPMNAKTGKFAGDAEIQAALDAKRNPVSAKVTGPWVAPTPTPASAKLDIGPRGNDSDKKPTSLAQDMELVWTNWETCKMLGEWDRERGYEENPPESFDVEQIDAYLAGFYVPEDEEVDETPMTDDGKLDAILDRLMVMDGRLKLLENGKK